MEKESVEVLNKLLKVSKLVAHEDYKESKILLDRLPPTKNKETLYKIYLLKAFVEFKVGDHYESLKYFNRALKIPVLDREDQKVTYVSALLNRSEVHRHLDHLGQRDVDIKRAMEYTKEHGLLKIKSIEDSFVSIMQARRLIPLTEITEDYLKESLIEFNMASTNN